jgi:hypothetical protein
MLRTRPRGYLGERGACGSHADSGDRLAERDDDDEFVALGEEGG